jgi:hypothetical protein
MLGIVQPASNALDSTNLDSPVTGGLAGLLSGAVFGGPVGLAIGLGVGLLTERMKRGALEATANDISDGMRLSQSLEQQIAASVPIAAKYGTEIDQKQLSDMNAQRERMAVLAQSSNPQTRNQALQQLGAIDSAMSSWSTDLEERTRELADAEVSRRTAIGIDFRDRRRVVQDRTQLDHKEANIAQELFNSLPIDSPALQAKLQTLAQASQRHAQVDEFGVSLAPLGVGFTKNFGDYKFGKDEAQKLISAFRRGATTLGEQELTALDKQMRDQGFNVGVTSSGDIEVRDVAALEVQNFRQSQQGAGNDAVDAPTPRPGVDPAEATGRDVGETVREKTGDILKGIRGFAGELGGDAILDFLSSGASSIRDLVTPPPEPESVTAGSGVIDRSQIGGDTRAQRAARRRPTN